MGRRKKKGRGKRIGSAGLVLGVWLGLFLYNWTYESADTAYIGPDVAYREIAELVGLRQVSEPKLELLSQQTGCSVSVVEQLLEQGRGEVLLEIQAAYFSPIEIRSIRSTPFTISEQVVDAPGRGMDFADIRDGDILITKNSRFLGWRNGHAGLVVDAKQGLVLEAVMLGTDTRCCSIEHWAQYPSVMVLRLREEFEKTEGSENTAQYQAKLAADYALEALTDVPYCLWAGVKDKLFSQLKAWGGVWTEGMQEPLELKGTQCAHLVWYAYKQAGIDLDSDGGLLVTPEDLRKSPYLEVIQSYGYE